jgi:ATP-dependent DNA ligase
MNLFAALIDRLAVAADDDMKHRLLMDYFATTPEPDRAVANAILSAKLKRKRVRLPLIRGLAEARLDPVLFALSLDFVGDMAETIALLWPARHGANKDPSLAEVVDALSALGHSELPKQIEAWLDASDANGRWALIKLMTGTLKIPVTAAHVAYALGAEVSRLDAAPLEQQDDMFEIPGNDTVPGVIDAVLMYVERGRSKSSPMICTFGVWKSDAVVPLGKADAAAARAHIETFVQDNTINRFGPVREVAHTRDTGLVLEVAFEGLKRSSRQKSGIATREPRINRAHPDKLPSDAAGIETLERLFPER